MCFLRTVEHFAFKKKKVKSTQGSCFCSVCSLLAAELVVAASSSANALSISPVVQSMAARGTAAAFSLVSEPAAVAKIAIPIARQAISVRKFCRRAGGEG